MFAQFLKLASFAALVIGFVGSNYVLISVVGVAAWYWGVLSASSLSMLMGLTFLVVTPVVIAFGFVITIESLMIAAATKDPKDVLVAIYNVFASVWDTLVYVEDFPSVVRLVESHGQESDSKRVLLIVVLVATMVSFLITYLAFMAGGKRAESFSAQPIA